MQKTLLHLLGYVLSYTLGKQLLSGCVQIHDYLLYTIKAVIMKMQQITIESLAFCPALLHPTPSLHTERMALTFQPGNREQRQFVMCAALPFLSPLVVVLKCHVKPKARKTLNDLLWLTVCVYCILYQLKHQQSPVSYQHIKSNRLETQISPSSQCWFSIVCA